MCHKCTLLANSISETVQEIKVAEKALRLYRRQLNEQPCHLKHPERRAYDRAYYEANRTRKLAAANARNAMLRISSADSLGNAKAVRADTAMPSKEGILE